MRDVSAGIINTLKTEDSIGKTYGLAGPDVFTVEQLVDLTFETIRERIRTVYLPSGAAKLLYKPIDLLSKKVDFLVVFQGLLSWRVQTVQGTQVSNLDV